METIHIAATDRSPEVRFDFMANHFSLKGESYPEDVTEFYGPVIGRLEQHLERLEDGALIFDFELIYFNSSSAKVLMGLFDLLDDVAGRGCRVSVNWRFEADDDNMEELGQEFAEDLSNVTFNLVPFSDA